VVEVLQEQTTDEARILWEDRLRGQTGSRWTTLLPMWTGRSFIGGLDPEGVIEHTTCGLAGPVLAGRPLEDWTDSDLAEYCRRYNVGWVVCRSPAAVARLRRWAGAALCHTFSGREGHLFALKRQPSFILHGKARWLGAGVNWVSLGDLEPEGGTVVVSLHYHEGLRVTPARVVLEDERADADPRDPIALIRLRVDAPVARLTLTWDR
jgi:hypothetical protein